MAAIKSDHVHECRAHVDRRARLDALELCVRTIQIADDPLWICQFREFTQVRLTS